MFLFPFPDSFRHFLHVSCHLHACPRFARAALPVPAAAVISVGAAATSKTSSPEAPPPINRRSNLSSYLLFSLSQVATPLPSRYITLLPRRFSLAKSKPLDLLLHPLNQAPVRIVITNLRRLSNLLWPLETLCLGQTSPTIGCLHSRLDLSAPDRAALPLFWDRSHKPTLPTSLHETKIGAAHY